MVAPRLLTLVSCLALVAGGASAAGASALVFPQEDTVDRLGKYRRYLDHDPFHEAVFERMMHEAVETGELTGVRAAYHERLAADAGDDAARVVLARIAAREGRSRDALESLAQVESGRAPLFHLRGKLHLALGELDPALAELALAAERVEDRLLAVEIHTLAGRTAMRAGNADAAAASFHALAELEPESFDLRLEAAALMEMSALDEAALAELVTAVALARDDAARRVRVWVAIGRLEERRGRVEPALAAYIEAIGLMGPGHWQRAELFERRLVLHRGRGTLGELVALARDESAALPTDPEGRGFLARALAAHGDTDGALEVLRAAVSDFPDSVVLGRLFAKQLTDAGRAFEAVAEYQRLAERHPAKVQLLIDAGLLLAALGQTDAARAQWMRSLERGGDSVARRIEIAGLQSQFGMHEEAAELLRSTVDEMPGDMRAVRALITRWDRASMGSRVRQLLERTEAAAVERGDASVLEELAGEWLVREDFERGIRLLELALEAGGDRARLLGQLAYHLEGTKRFEQTAEVYAELFTLARTARERADLARRIGALYENDGRLGRMEFEQGRALEEARLAGVDAPLATILLAHARGRRGATVEANELLLEMANVDAHREDAYWHLSWLAEEKGDHAIAAQWLRELMRINPRGSQRTLEDIARLHRRAGDEEALDATYDEMLAMNPTSRALLEDLASRYQKRRPKHAIALLSRSVELHPGAAETRLTLADLLLRQGRNDDAREQLARVVRSREAELRARARSMYRQRVVPKLRPEIEVEELRARLAANPSRFEFGVLLALRSIELYDYDTAYRTIVSLLRRFPRAPALLEVREELRGLTLASLASELDPVAAAGDPPPTAIAVASVLFAQGEHLRARDALADLDDPVLAANVCLAYGDPSDAERILRDASRADPSNVHLRIRLAVTYLAGGRENRAARAIDEASALAGRPWSLLLLQGELRHRRGYRQMEREVGRALFGRLQESRELAAHGPVGRAVHERRVETLVDFYVSRGLERDFLALGRETLERSVGDPPLFNAVLSRMDERYHARPARALLAAAQRVPAPKGWDAAGWTQLLTRHGQRFAPRRRR